MKAKQYFLLSFLLYTTFCASLQGQDWQQVRVGDGNGVAVLPTGMVVAVVGGITYRSIDGGQSWTVGGGVPSDLTALRVHPNGTIYTGSLFGRSGLIFSTDQGITWSSYQNISAWDVAFNSQGHIFAATEALFVLRSIDSGVTWFGGGQGSPMWSVAVDGQNHIYAGTQFGGLYRSIDNGTNWTYLPQDAPAVVDGLAIAPDGTIYMSGATGLGVMQGPLPMVGFYRSTDRGISWEDISVVDSVQVGKNVVITSAGVIYVGASYPHLPNAVVLMSTDRGEHWQPLSQDMAWGGITGIALDGEGRLYVATSTGIYMREGVSSAPEPGSLFSDRRHLSVITEPNTLESSLRIAVGEHTRAGLQLIDMQGRIVKQIELQERGAGESRFNVADFGLPQGVYLCRYADGETSETMKVLVR